MKNENSKGPGSILASATSAVADTKPIASATWNAARASDFRRTRHRPDWFFAVSSMNLVIDPTLLSTLVAHAERDYPNECCGILVGARRGLDRIIHRVVQSNNITEGDRRRNYQVDWKTLLRTQRQARAYQMEIVGFYHSHPDGSARPSQRDLDHAWSDCSYLILAVVAGRVVDSASWRSHDGRRTFEFEPFAPPDRATPACADVMDRAAAHG